MKKLISLIGAVALTSAGAFPLVGCGVSDDSLKIAFVPSKDPIAIMPIVKPLENLLKNKIHELDPEFNKSVKISTTTNYQAAGQALQDGKTALAFLPVGTYTDYRGNETSSNNYSDAAPLVVAQRAAMIPDSNNNTAGKRVISLEEQIATKNNYNDLTAKGIADKEEAYNVLYHKSGGATASFYRSEVLVNKAFYDQETATGEGKKGLNFDDPSTYQKNIQQLISDAKKQNKIELLESNTSGAGVIYPVKWMKDNGLEDSTIVDILKNQPRVKDYGTAAERVATGASLITFGYSDIRADSANVKFNYDNTKMVGLTSGIPNDGISYSKKAIKDQKLLAAIRQAFKALIQDPNNADIFGVYSHTDYLVPDKDATPEQVLQWEMNENKSYNEANKDLEEAIKIIKSVQ